MNLTRPDTQKLLQDFKLFPRKVVYGEEEGINLVLREVDEFFERIGRFRQPFHEDVEVHEYINNVVRWLPSIIKHPSYQHESEIRFIRLDIGESVGNPIKFFDRNGIQVPFVEICHGRTLENSGNSRFISIFDDVIVGPSGESESILDSVNYWGEKKRWIFGSKKSDIPYRVL